MLFDASAIRRTGSLRQLAGTRHCILTNGGAGGVRAIDVNTGGGLHYTILPDRGLDISLASFRGVNFSYLSPQEELSAAYYDCQADGWLRTFYAGLLTTCGPVNYGPACEYGGVTYSLHGRFNVTPAVNVCDMTDVSEGIIKVSGRIANFVLFGEKIEIRRTISSVVGQNTIRINDVVTNHSDTDTPNMMMYHINFGYPLLDEDAEIYVGSESYAGFDENSRKFIDEIWSFGPPCVDNREKNYLHTMNRDVTGTARLRNDKLGFGVEISFNTATLPYLNQWKYERTRDYVLGLEPANAPCDSIMAVSNAGKLPVLGAGCSVTHDVEIAIVT